MLTGTSSKLTTEPAVRVGKSASAGGPTPGRGVGGGELGRLKAKYHLHPQGQLLRLQSIPGEPS